MHEFFLALVLFGQTLDNAPQIASPHVTLVECQVAATKANRQLELAGNAPKNARFVCMKLVPHA